MKTEEYMLDYAIKIASENSDAFIGVFYDTWQSARKSFNNVISKPGDFAITSGGSLKLSFAGNSRIQFITIKEETINDLSGCQFSHVFIIEHIEERCQRYLESKIRTAYNFEQPSGLYGCYGAKIYVGY